MTPFERLIERPWGPHDPETAELSLLLRTGPVAGKLTLIALGRGRCALARMPDGRHDPIVRLGPEYDSVVEGERDVLLRRYAALRP